MALRRDSSVSSLGARTIRSPLRLAPPSSHDEPVFTPDGARVLREIELPRQVMQVDPAGELWREVMSTTGQPSFRRR